MKKINHILLTLLFWVVICNLRLIAQQPAPIASHLVEGLFLNFQDYQTGKLTSLTDRKHASDKIRMNQFFFSPTLISIENKQKKIYRKDSIFAIRMLNGANYRFISNYPFRIVDTSCLYIYVYETIWPDFSRNGPRTVWEDRKINNIYFSRFPHQNLYPLNLNELLAAFKPEKEIQAAILSTFNDTTLLQSNENGYQINSFLQKYKKIAP